MGTKQTQNCVGGTKFNFKDWECCFQMFCSSGDKKTTYKNFTLLEHFVPPNFMKYVERNILAEIYISLRVS